MRIHCLPLWLCGLSLAIGCQPVATPDSADFGRFEGEVVASWDADGRKMTLRENFAYVDSKNRRWTAPTGSVVDGASIPAAFWTFVGGPFEGKYRNASVVHDIGCIEMTATWEDVHRMFYEACRCSGVDETMAKMLYYAVYHFGPRWQLVTETRIETRTNADGQAVSQPVTQQRMVRIDPPPPTLEEVQQVEALIVEENPEPSVIERTDREAIRRRPRRGPSRDLADGGKARPSSSLEKAEPTARKRPEVAAVHNGNGGKREEGLGERVAPGAERTQREGGHKVGGDPRGTRASQPQTAAATPAVTSEEQQWAAQQVRRHIEKQTSQERPAEYDVERTGDGYRVVVRYRHLDKQGQPTSNAGGNSTVRLSREGQVLEMISGR